jgi:hypothetical protein
MLGITIKANNVKAKIAYRVIELLSYSILHQYWPEIIFFYSVIKIVSATTWLANRIDINCNR